ncbi:MAG: GntP family permease [Deltaproteobacteria bacterium]|jgi:H+/gluconate symporter-like permease|nr:GntP family permease [Deltaproteobacteria bacterium]
MVIGIILSLLLLTYIAYRGLSVILFAPVCALLAAVTAGWPLLPSYTEIFMTRGVIYVKNFFPIFLLGAVFGKVMEESGCARSIAKLFAETLGSKHACVAVALTTAVLTYGGISMFVAPFAVYPFAYALFKDAGIPRRLIPGSICIGTFTFAMTCMPGSPQIQNMIPATYFGTTLFSAPIFGITGTILTAGISLWWISWRQKSLMHEGFGELDTRSTTNFDDGVVALPNPWLAMVPCLIVLVGNISLTLIIRGNEFLGLPGWDQDVMKLPQVVAQPLAAKRIPDANWGLLISLVVAILVAIAISLPAFKARQNLQATLNAGAIGSLLAIMNTASEVGYGNVVSSLPGFTAVRDFLMGINFGDSPLMSEFIFVNVLAGITGSASGGMSIALEAMGKTFMEWGAQSGIGPELLHRVAAMASGGLDSLPHNGAIITLMAITGMTHKQSYPDCGLVSVVVPIGVTFILVVVWSLFKFPFA